MLRAKSVVYCSVDPFLSSRGKFLYGFDRFQAELDRLEIPCVWLSAQSRLQLDEPRRRAGHTEPFIAEGGCAVYLPEDYFHLNPKTTMRLGRFTSIPIAKRQPAAAEALESLSEETGVPVVALSSLSPRELSQNLGVPAHEAEHARQRDFDELFFFAGAAEKDITRFENLAQQKKFSLQKQGILWSIAIGRDVQRCIRELGELYDRSLRGHVNRFAIASGSVDPSVFAACDRGVRLVTKTTESSESGRMFARFADVPLASPDLWENVLSQVIARP